MDTVREIYKAKNRFALWCHKYDIYILQSEII